MVATNVVTLYKLRKYLNFLLICISKFNTTIMSKPLYPIKFAPILKDKIWGGDKLKNVLNKKSNLDNIGESWELSGVEGDI